MMASRTIVYENLELAKKLIDLCPSIIGSDNAYIEELQDHLDHAEKAAMKDEMDDDAGKTLDELRAEYKDCPAFFEALFMDTKKRMRDDDGDDKGSKKKTCM